MEPNKFYTHVSSWIKSYRNPDSLYWLRKFINNSGQPLEIKEKLHQEIDIKVAGLQNKPVFGNINGDQMLLDSNGVAHVFTTRFSAVCKLAELRVAGYDAELHPGKVFYRIKLASNVDKLINEIS